MAAQLKSKQTRAANKKPAAPEVAVVMYGADGQPLPGSAAAPNASASASAASPAEAATPSAAPVVSAPVVSAAK